MKKKIFINGYNWLYNIHYVLVREYVLSLAELNIQSRKGHLRIKRLRQARHQDVRRQQLLVGDLRAQRVQGRVPRLLPH